MDFPIHIDTISMALPGVTDNVLNYSSFLSLKVVLNFADSADPDEMQYSAAFHLGLHCLPK